MKKYDDSDERKIRLERRVREWLKSGLIDQSQHDAIAPEFKTELRRTNLFLRLILFGFGFFIIAAAVLLVGVVSGIRNDAGMAAICLFAAAATFGLAEVLIGEFRLYRFGIEEAAAMISAVLMAVGIAFLRSSTPATTVPTEFVFLIVGAVSALMVYLRFGYLYAAIASMLCAAFAPFGLRAPEVTERLIAAAVLAILFIVIRSLLREADPEFPGDDYRAIQAVALAGVYAALNLKLSSVLPSQPFYNGLATPPPFWFYGFTYLMIWLLPVIGLRLGLRDKDRPLIDVGIVLGLVTLMTNKPYLGAARQTWDPILFGLVLTATAIAVRRWLSKGENGFRYGYSAERLLSSDKRKLSIAGTAAAFASFHAPASNVTTSATPSPQPAVDTTDGFKSGGGRSGGAGASGSF